MASTEGGVEIEKVAAETPEKILKATIDPLTGPQPYQGRELAFQLGLSGDQIKQFVKIFMGLAQLFVDKDLALIEINPLVVTGAGEVIALDAKMNFDDNALYRHPDIAKLRDLEAAGTTQFNIYLDSGDEEKIIADYGEKIIPVFQQEAAAKKASLAAS